jgi:hypothetical protein
MSQSWTALSLPPIAVVGIPRPLQPFSSIASIGQELAADGFHLLGVPARLRFADQTGN